MQQQQLEVMNFIAGYNGDINPVVTEFEPVILNGSTDVMTNSTGLWFLHFKGTDVFATINVSYKGRSVKQIAANHEDVDTGEIFIICDEIDALGIDDSSGTISCTGWTYTPPVV